MLNQSELSVLDIMKMCYLENLILPSWYCQSHIFPDCILSGLYFFKGVLWNHGSIKFPGNSLLIAMGVIALHSSLNLLSMGINFWNRTWEAQAASCQHPNGYSELVLVLKTTHTSISSFLPWNTDPDFRHSWTIYFVSLNKYILCCICCEIATEHSIVKKSESILYSWYKRCAYGHIKASGKVWYCCCKNFLASGQ